MRAIRYIIVCLGVSLAAMVWADDYVDDVYYWPHSRMAMTKTTTQTETETQTQTQTQILRADTIWEQPSDTVVRMTIRR